MLKLRLLLLAGVILAACVAGCAHPQPATPPAPVATAPPPPTPMSPAQQAQHTQTVQAMQQSARARGRMLHQQAGKQ